MADESKKNVSTDIEESRRRFVKTAGRLALYTPPAVVLLMQPSRNAVAASSGVNNGTSFLNNDGAAGTPGNSQNDGGIGCVLKKIVTLGMAQCS